MSFLTDLFHGNFSNLGNDLSAKNFFKDANKANFNQIGGKNTGFDIAAGLTAAALATGGVGLAGGFGGAAGAGAGAGLAAGDIGAGALGFGAEELGGTGLLASAGDLGAGAGAGDAFSAGILPLGTTGVGASEVGAPLDLLGFGSAAGTAGPGFVGDISAGTLGGTAGFDLGLDGGMSGLNFSGVSSFAGAPGGGGGSAAAQPGSLESFLANPGGGPPGMTGAASPGGTSASAFGAPAGVTPDIPADPTSFGLSANDYVDNANVFNRLDAAAPAAPTAPGAAGAPSNFLGDMGTGAVKSLTSNPLGIGLGAAGLGYSMLAGQKDSAAVNDLKNVAAPALAQGQQIASQGQTMAQYLPTGTLPPGMMAQVDQALAAKRANIISNFASQGMSTDPAQNTALAAELNQLAEQKSILTAQLGQQLLQSGSSLINSGISESGLASNIYTTLANIDQTQTAAVGSAIANFASAFGGGNRTNIQIGGTAHA